MTIDFRDLRIVEPPEGLFDLTGKSDLVMEIQGELVKVLARKIGPSQVMEIETMATMLAVISLVTLGDSSRISFTRANISRMTEVLIGRILATADAMCKDAEVPN